MATDLVVPIYIDTNALLDLLASIEGGFSVVEKVSSKNQNSDGIDRKVDAQTGTEFGIPNVLSLLKLTIGYSANWKKSNDTQQERETERYHTYGSLFNRLREYLDTNDLIKRLDGTSNAWEALQPSEFVEIHGLFRPNPFANSLEIIERLIRVFQVVSVMQLNNKKPLNANKGKLTPDEKQKIEEEKEQARSQTKMMEQINNIIQGVLKDIQTEKIRIFVIDTKAPSGYRAVATLALDYLRDQTMTEISYKEYRLLGKVVRKVTENDNPVDLLLGTGLGGIGKETLAGIASMFSQMPGMNLPEMQTEVTGPAIEVVPVAIFV